jgi:hypothetical protein
MLVSLVKTLAVRVRDGARKGLGAARGKGGGMGEERHEGTSLERVRNGSQEGCLKVLWARGGRAYKIGLCASSW